MRQIGYRYQRTLARAVGVRGTGFVTGSPVRVRLCPAPEDTGLVFVRTGLAVPAPSRRPRPRG